MSDAQPFTGFSVPASTIEEQARAEAAGRPGPLDAARRPLGRAERKRVLSNLADPEIEALAAGTLEPRALALPDLETARARAPEAARGFTFSMPGAPPPKPPPPFGGRQGVFVVRPGDGFTTGTLDAPVDHVARPADEYPAARAMPACLAPGCSSKEWGSFEEMQEAHADPAILANDPAHPLCLWSASPHPTRSGPIGLLVPPDGPRFGLSMPGRGLGDRSPLERLVDAHVSGGEYSAAIVSGVNGARAPRPSGVSTARPPTRHQGTGQRVRAGLFSVDFGASVMLEIDGRNAQLPVLSAEVNVELAKTAKVVCLHPACKGHEHEDIAALTRSHDDAETLEATGQAHPYVFLARDANGAAALLCYSEGSQS